MSNNKIETLKEILKAAKESYHNENEIAQERVIDWVLYQIDKLEQEKDRVKCIQEKENEPI